MDYLPKHVTTFFSNLDEVRRLVDIHGQVAGTHPGYKANVEVLNKSGIVLLVACWEAFVEDLLENSFDFLIQNASTHTVLPMSVLVDASEDLKKSLDNRAVWQLAGNGWISVLKAHKHKSLKRYLFGFNAPKPENIDKLFKAVLGIPSISSHWHWPRMPATNASKNLTSLVELRGSIAHRVAASQKVYKDTVIDYVGFVNRLAVLSHNRVGDHLNTLTGKQPWERYTFGAVG